MNMVDVDFSKIKNRILLFLIKRQEQSAIKYNFIFAVAFLIMLYLGDVFLTLIGRTNIVIEFILTFIIFFASFVLSFCNKYVKIIITTIAMIFVAINLNCITYFNSPLTIDQIYAAFKEYGDVFDCFDQVWFIEFFILIPYALVIFLSIFYDKKYYRSSFSLWLLLYGFYWVYLLAMRGQYLYAVPIKTRVSVINSFRTIPWFLTHFNLKPDDDFPEETRKPYEIKKVNKNTPRVMFLIWGESTNPNYLSLFGKSRFIDDLKTTPKLEKIIANEKDKYTVLKAISSSSFTCPSTTLFFNLLHTPGNLFEIAHTEKQNLFTLAKQNGYKTHWLSVSASNVMETGAMPAEHIVAKDTHAPLPENKRDDYLLNEVKKLDLSEGKHFVVIQFHSLHETYDDNYALHRDEYEYFKLSKNDDRRTNSRKRYINNVMYLDYLLTETIKTAKEKDADYVVYTADHGECLGTDLTDLKDGDYYGHGKLGFCCMVVPFVFYQKNPDLSLKRSLEDKKVSTHYEISSLVANLLGYDVKRPNEEKDIFFMYQAFPARKSVEFKKVKREDGWFKELYQGTVLDYLIKTYNFKPKQR